MVFPRRFVGGARRALGWLNADDAAHAYEAGRLDIQS